MSTRATLRTTIRAELNDAGGTALWATTLLDRWITDAIRAWSRDVPRERTWSQTTTANDGSYALPADWIDGIRVEHPSGCYRVRSTFVAGDVNPGTLVTVDVGVRPDGLLWDVWAGELVLSPAPAASGETISVRNMASYTSVSDDVTTRDVPAAEEEALVWWVCVEGSCTTSPQGATLLEAGSLMPKGVEHSVGEYVELWQPQVKSPLMPKGVEHSPDGWGRRAVQAVKSPLMPKGVEHAWPSPGCRRAVPSSLA